MEFKFALNLLKTTTGNACVSPLNIAHALGLVMLGAENETREEVAKGTRLYFYWKLFGSLAGSL